MRNWLIETRKNSGRSQYKIADSAGVAQSTYAQIETGTRNPSVTTAKKIAAVLGFEWTKFFDEEEQK